MKTALPLSEVPGMTVLGAGCARDMDLLRAVLLEASAAPGLRDFSGWDAATVREHAGLLVESGHAYGQCLRDESGGAMAVVFGGLTWQGHELAAAVAGEAVWKKVLAGAQRLGGVLSLEVMKSLASAATAEFIKP